ncbi:DNA-binding protein [Megasphaera sp. AM44-1BH]|nr:DNA-binding protein [Megasphaera sp. AM44-1BH]
MFSRDMIYRMARRKEIPSMKIGRRVLFSDKAMDQWIAEQNELPIPE